MVNDILVQKDGTLSGVRKKSRLGLIVAAIILVASIGAWVGFVRWKTARSLISSSSAMIAADSSVISTSVDGTVQQLLVKPGQLVKQGDVLAIIANPALVQKYADAEKAVVDAKRIDVTTQAAIIPPAMVGSILPSGPSLNFKLLKPLPAAGLSVDNRSPLDPNSKQVPMDKKSVLARSNLAASQKLVDKRADQLKSAQTDLETAQSNLSTQSVPLEALKSALDLAKGKRDKFQGLYNDGIISRSEFQHKQSDYETAQSNVDDANKAIQTAQDDVNAKQAVVSLATKSLDAAKVAASKSQELLTKSEATAAKSSPSFAPPPPVKAIAPMARRHEKMFMPHFAFTAPAIAPLKVAFSPDKHLQAETQVEVASRKLKQISELLQECRITAKSDGTISNIQIKEGEQLAANTPMITLTKPASQRVVAIFDHEEALRIHYGQKCEVSFDAIPHHVFTGQIARFLEGGQQNRASKIEILLPNEMDLLATLPAGSVSHVKVFTS